MNIPRGTTFSEENARVDLTPLVDVVFLLVIFFVLAVPSIMLPMGIKVRLPITSAATRLQSGRMEVTITAADEIFMGGEKVSLAELRRRAEAFTAGGGSSAHLRGDVSATLGRIVAVYGALKKAGIQSISVATGIQLEADKDRRP